VPVPLWTGMINVSESVSCERLNDCRSRARLQMREAATNGRAVGAAGSRSRGSMANGPWGKTSHKWSKCSMRSSRVELVSSSSIDRRYRRLQAAPRGTKEGQDARGRNMSASSKDRLMVISPGWPPLSPAMPSSAVPTRRDSPFCRITNIVNYHADQQV
jgi:hypothetical protein